MAFFDQYKQIDRKSVAATDKNDSKARLLAAVGDPKTKGAAAAIIRVLLDFKVAQKNTNDNTAERKLATLATNVQRVNSASPPRPGSQPLTVDELQKFVRNSSAIFQKALPATFKALLEEVLPDRDVRSRLVDSSTAAFLRANGLITANDVHNAIAVGATERPTLAEISRWLNGYVAKQGDALETHRAQTLPLFLNQCAADFLRTNQANDKTFYRERATPHAVRVLEALHGTDSTHALRTPTFADAVPKEMRNLYVKRRIDAQSAGGPSASKGPMMARVFGDNYGPEKSVTPDPIKKLHEDRALFLKWKKRPWQDEQVQLGLSQAASGATCSNK